MLESHCFFFQYSKSDVEETINKKEQDVAPW